MRPITLSTYIWACEHGIKTYLKKLEPILILTIAIAPTLTTSSPSHTNLSTTPSATTSGSSSSRVTPSVVNNCSFVNHSSNNNRD